MLGGDEFATENMNLLLGLEEGALIVLLQIFESVILGIVSKVFDFLCKVEFSLLIGFHNILSISLLQNKTSYYDCFPK